MTRTLGVRPLADGQWRKRGRAFASAAVDRLRGFDSAGGPRISVSLIPAFASQPPACRILLRHSSPPAFCLTTSGATGFCFAASPPPAFAWRRCSWIGFAPERHCQLLGFDDRWKVLLNALCCPGTKKGEPSTNQQYEGHNGTAIHELAGAFFALQMSRYCSLHDSGDQF